MTYSVHHIDIINNSKVVPILAKCIVAQAEYGNYDISIYWELQALYIEDCGEVVAAIAYENQKHKKQTYISAVYVEPKNRRCGMYRALWNELVKRSRESKMRSIAGGISPHNEAMIAAAKSVGRKIQYASYVLEL